MLFISEVIKYFKGIIAKKVTTNEEQGKVMGDG